MDVLKIISNCYIYNKKDTFHFRAGSRVEKLLLPILKESERLFSQLPLQSEFNILSLSISPILFTYGLPDSIFEAQRKVFQENARRQRDEKRSAFELKVKLKEEALEKSKVKLLDQRAKWKESRLNKRKKSASSIESCSVLEKEDRAPEESRDLSCHGKMDLNSSSSKESPSFESRLNNSASIGSDQVGSVFIDTTFNEPTLIDSVFKVSPSNEPALLLMEKEVVLLNSKLSGWAYVPEIELERKVKEEILHDFEIDSVILSSESPMTRHKLKEVLVRSSILTN